MSNLATAERLRRATSQLPVSWYCDPAVYEAEQRPAVRARARLRRARADGARTPATTTRSPWRDNAQVLVRNAERRRAPVQHLPAPAGDHAARAAATRRTSSARSTAGPTTSRASSSARRISPTSRASTSRRSPLAELERPAVRRPARRRARPRRARRAGTSTSPATCSTASRCTSATTTGRSFIEVYLEDYHVAPVPSGPRPVRHLRRPASGSSATGYSVQTVGVNNGLAKPGTQDLRALAQGGARLLPRRDAARTARSG